MRRIVIYARGKIFERYITKIKLDDVVAIVDKTAKQGEFYEKIPVVLPEALCGMRYDYVVVFSDLYFESIMCELQDNYSIAPEKIMSWRALTDCQSVNANVLQYVGEYVKKHDARYMLDCNISYLYQYYLTKESLYDNMVRLDGVGEAGYGIVNRLYDTIYSCPTDTAFGAYDLVLWWGLTQDKDMLKQVLRKTKACLFITEYKELMNMNVDELLQELSSMAKVNIHRDCEGWIWELTDIKERQEFDAHIYVVTHKEYDILQDELYTPICVGSYENPEFLADNVGDNISSLNEKINECTALYWMWKNRTDRYVGLSHYRRYLKDDRTEKGQKYLCKETIERIMAEYDIIMADINYTHGGNVLHEIKFSVQNDEIFENGYRLMREEIGMHQPEYVEAFDNVMNGNREYICNLFVTRREILERYCEWLFSFLPEVARRTDVSMCTGNSKRVIGFFAERMWTVWLLKQELRIKELPILMR